MERCKEIHLEYMTSFKEEKSVQTFQFSLLQETETQTCAGSVTSSLRSGGCGRSQMDAHFSTALQARGRSAFSLGTWLACDGLGWQSLDGSNALVVHDCFQEDWKLLPWSRGLNLSVRHPAALLKAPSRDALKLGSRRGPCLNSWPSELWNTMKWLLFKASEFGEHLLCCNA